MPTSPQAPGRGTPVSRAADRPSGRPRRHLDEAGLIRGQDRVNRARAALRAGRPKIGNDDGYHARCVDLLDALEDYAVTAGTADVPLSSRFQVELRLYRSLTRATRRPMG
jgi:hypothetical protein